MKIRFAFFFVLAMGCSHGKKNSEPLQIPKFATTVVPHFKVDETILQRIPYGAIRKGAVDKVRSLVQAFPLQNYQMVGVYSGFEVEYFCIDALEDSIKNELRSGRSWEGHLTQYLVKYCRLGSVAIDIGAHIGTHAIQLSRLVGKTGRVYAFEPQPKIFTELLVNMTLNQADNIDYYWAAAGSKHGTIELSPLVTKNEGGTILGSGGTGEFVDVIPIDSLQLKNVSFVKVDVENMEIEVLRGMLETIQREKPIMLIEIMGGIKPEDVSKDVQKEILSRIRFVENLGYEMIRIYEQWDYLAIPRDSEAFAEMQKTRMYRYHLRKFKKWAEGL